jgi:hypothetical protein
MSGNKNNQGGASGSEENSRPEFGDTLDPGLFKSSGVGPADLNSSRNENLPKSESSEEHGSGEPTPDLAGGTLLPETSAEFESDPDAEVLDSGITHQYEEDELIEA